MNRVTPRWKTILLALVMMLALVLQACSKDRGGAGTGAANEPSANALEPREVKITYFGAPQADDALVEAKLNEYFKPRINATVKLMPFASSDYKTRTELMMNTGEKMDLVFATSWLDFFSNVSKGAYLELDELLEMYGQGIKESLNPLYLEAPRLNGKLYAIPTNKEITQGKALIYRKDIVDKYRIPVDDIRTLEELKPWIEVVREGEPELIPYYVNGGSGNYTMGYSMYEMRSNYRGVGPLIAKTPMFLLDYTATADMTVRSVIDPEIEAVNIEEVELFRDLYVNGLLNTDAGTSTTEISDLQRQGKIWVQTGTWKPGVEIEMSNSVNNRYEYVSRVIEEPIVTTELATGSMFAISRTSPDPARAMMVLNYLHTDPYVVNLLVNGIEGEHYTKVGENRIEPIMDSGYGETALFWVVGNQLINYLRPGQPDDLYENWQNFNNEAKRFPLMGFVFDDTGVKNEIAQMTAIVTEYKAIYTGAVKDPAKLLAERNGRLKAAGIEAVQAELQRQIDAWRASQ